MARLIPELRERLPDLPEAVPISDTHAGKFRLFQATTDLLKRAASAAPLLLVLDDLHWADQSTLQLLEHAALQLARSGVLLVGTYRDAQLGRQHPLEQALAGIGRAEHFQTLDLRGLSEPDVAAYVAAATGIEPSKEALKSVYQETEGNAFFLQEVVALMSREGTLDSGDVRVPPSVRAAIGRRLNSLSDPTNELLHTAAVVGREFSEALLLRLDLEGADVVADSLESALAAGVVEELGRIGEYRFTHALIQETLLDELRTSQRVRLHGRIAEALEAFHGDRAGAQATQLATHYAESSTLSVEHAAKAMRYSLLAAREAEQTFAWAEATRLYGQAASLSDEDPDLNLDIDRADLYSSLARAADGAAEYRLSWRAMMTAAELFRQRGDGVGIARLCPRSVAIWAPTRRVAALLLEALDLIDDRNDVELALLGEVAAVLCFFKIRPFVTDQEIEPLVAELRQRAASEDLSQAVTEQLRWIDGWDAVRNGDLSTVIDGYMMMTENPTFGWQLAGELEKARDAADVIAQDRSLDLTSRAMKVAVQMALALIRAEPEEFERLYTDGPRIYLCDLLRAIRALELGDVDRAIRSLPDPAVAAGNPDLLAYIHGIRCVIFWHAGRSNDAAAEFQRALDSSEASGYPGLRAGAALLPADLNIHVNPPFIFDVVAAHLANEQERAALQVIVRSQPGFTAGRVVSWPWCNQRVYGDWALVLGMDADAERLFTDALEWCERERCPIEAGRCHQGLAEVAVRHGQTAEALRHLDAGSKLFEQHGAKLYLDQARAREEELRSTPAGRPSHPDALSDREVEVLRLVAVGNTNAQIAERLVIAPGTVARHVSNILNKTALANRTELAAYAVAHGLAGA